MSDGLSWQGSAWGGAERTELPDEHRSAALAAMRNRHSVNERKDQ